MEHVRTPSLYSLLCQAYSFSTRLFFGEEGFASETGIQQGTPIGPSLFTLSVDEAARSVQSEFNVWYLNETTLGDSSERVHEDLVVLLKRLRVIVIRANVSSTFSMTKCRRQRMPCSEGSLRELRWLKHVTFHCWDPRWKYKAFWELFVRIEKRYRENVVEVGGAEPT